MCRQRDRNTVEKIKERFEAKAQVRNSRVFFLFLFQRDPPAQSIKDYAEAKRDSSRTLQTGGGMDEVNIS